MFQLQLFFCSIVTNGTALQLCRDTSLSQELHYCSQVQLKERRRTNKIILLHKILYDETPEYLLNEILLHANHQSSNDLRSNRVFDPSLCNTTSYKCSFFPNVIDSWNLLDVDTQDQHSRLMFKNQISSNISVPPPTLPWVQENIAYSIVNLETWQVT